MIRGRKSSAQASLAVQDASAWLMCRCAYAYPGLTCKHTTRKHKDSIDVGGSSQRVSGTRRHNQISTRGGIDGLQENPACTSYESYVSASERQHGQGNDNIHQQLLACCN